MKYYSLTICIAFILMWAWLMVPADKMLNPYPLFRKFSISAQFYYMYAGIFFLMAVQSIIIAAKTDDWNAWIIAVLFVNLFIDYLLHYLHPYGWFVGNRIIDYKPESGLYVPISYPLFMGIILIYLSWKSMF